MTVIPIITNVRLRVRSGNETFYTNSNIDELVDDNAIYDFAEAVNSMQNGVMTEVSRTRQYRLAAQM